MGVFSSPKCYFRNQVKHYRDLFQNFLRLTSFPVTINDVSEAVFPFLTTPNVFIVISKATKSQ